MNISDNNLEVNWYRIYIFLIGGSVSNLGKYTFNSGNTPNTREWKDLYNCQLKAGKYSEVPFLLRSAAILNDIMPCAMKRQHILFNKFQTKSPTSVDADISVGQAIRPEAVPEGIG